jgi:hypothetical protein
LVGLEAHKIALFCRLVGQVHSRLIKRLFGPAYALNSRLIFATYSLFAYNLCMDFELVTSYKLHGDQPRMTGELIAGLAAAEKHQVLLGVTGSGKTFTKSRRPALPVLSSRQRWAGTNL